MREIPSLQSICFRSVGSPACSTEEAFCPLDNNDVSLASRLLRRFHDAKMTRIPCIGQVRRENANQVDLHHPFVGARLENGQLVAQYGNPALDVLQSYLDALVEMGRMDDRRLGKRFFEEYKANIRIAETNSDVLSPPDPKKTKRSSRSVLPVLASLSLYNCSIGRDTFEALIASGLANHLAVLDLTGVNGLTDELCRMILKEMPYLQRLSVKNCRRISIQALTPLEGSDHLACLDLGGCFNMSAVELLQHVVPKVPALTELHASGLGWTDVTVGQLMELRQSWSGLSFGFALASPTQNLTAKSLREDLVVCSKTLRSLALPFCETLVDNALLGMLGRNFPALQFLDLRGNPALQTVTGWYDGRASADLPPQPLTVLGRYTSLSASSVEETKRIHPLETMDLVVILDGGGTGAAIPIR
jgi:hypothetical protein